MHKVQSPEGTEMYICWLAYSSVAVGIAFLKGGKEEWIVSIQFKQFGIIFHE